MQVLDGVSGLHSGCSAMDGLPGGKSTQDSVSLPAEAHFRMQPLYHQLLVTHNTCHSFNSLSAFFGGPCTPSYTTAVRSQVMLAMTAMHDAPASTLAA